MNEEIRNLLNRAREVAVSATETAGQALNAAGRKANAIWDLARCNLQLNDIRGEIDRLLRELGSMVYRTHVRPDTPSDDLPRKLSELDGLYARLAEIEKELEELKIKQLCPVCGCGYDKQDAFCRSCGHAMGGRTGPSADN
ncbi:MAG: hypothetical protein FWH06_07365 [Oscillospiraceae bacterium]|nr:hypothetical protein [Oscillospiraceae bacterium]